MLNVSLSTMAEPTGPSPLLPISEDPELCLRWCKQNDLLSCECLCLSCRGSTMFITGCGNDSWMWRCRRKSCERRISLRVGTIFEGSNLSFSKIMQLSCWSKDLSVAGVAEEVDMSQVTLVDWFIQYREICASCLLKTSQPWWARTGRRNRRVQVWHRKILCYNRGRHA